MVDVGSGETLLQCTVLYVDGREHKDRENESEVKKEEEVKLEMERKCKWTVNDGYEWSVGKGMKDGEVVKC